MRRDVYGISYPVPVVKVVAIIDANADYEYEVEGMAWFSDDARNALMALVTALSAFHLEINSRESLFLLMVYPKSYEVRFVSSYASLFRSVSEVRKMIARACHCVARDVARMLRSKGKNAIQNE